MNAMSRIEQVYCTHCTPATAVFGDKYTARAGSLPQRELKELYYGTLDQFHNYRPPRDTPHEIRAIAGPEHMPARLMFVPECNGHSLLGQICYRQRDSTGTRVGSYFAHFLVAPCVGGQPAWPAIDCLRLWRSPVWVSEDSSTFDTTLPPLSADELRRRIDDRESAAISEDVLRSFLTAPAGGPFHDPGGVIPEEPHRQSPPESRQRLFKHVLRGFLELNLHDHETLLVVADAEFAALLFFGVLRLLPPRYVGDRVSFSTFQDELKNLTTTLVGTTFFDPAATLLTPTERSAAKFVLDTFHESTPSFTRAVEGYTDLVVDALVTHGWDETDWLIERLSDLTTTPPTSVENLQALVDAHETTLQLFRGDGRALNQLTPAAEEYARRSVREFLVECEQPDEELARLGRSPNISILLRLLFAESHGQINENARRLIPHLHTGVLVREADREILPVDYRLLLLHEFVRREKRFPDAMAGAFQPASADGTLPPLAPIATLLPRFVEETPAGNLCDLYAHYLGEATSLAGQVLQKVAIACVGPKSVECREALWRIVVGSTPLNREHANDTQVQTAVTSVVRDRLMTTRSPDGKPTIARELRDLVLRSGNLRLLLQRLFDGRPDSATLDVAFQICRGLDEPRLTPYVRDETLPRVLRLRLLAALVEAKKEMPAGLQAIYQPTKDSPWAGGLLEELLPRLSTEAIVELWDNAAAPTQLAIERALLGLREPLQRKKITDPERLDNAWATILDRWDHDVFLHRVGQHGPRLVDACPREVLATELRYQLNALRQPPPVRNLERCLEFLQQFCRHAPADLPEAQTGNNWLEFRERARSFRQKVDLAQEWPAVSLVEVCSDLVTLYEQLCPYEPHDELTGRFNGLLAQVRQFTGGEWRMPAEAIDALWFVHGEAVMAAEIAQVRWFQYEDHGRMGSGYVPEPPRVTCVLPAARAPFVGVKCPWIWFNNFGSRSMQSNETPKNPTFLFAVNLKSHGIHAEDVGAGYSPNKRAIDFEIKFSCPYWREDHSTNIFVALNELTNNVGYHLHLVDRNGIPSCQANFLFGLLNGAPRRTEG